MRLEDALRFNGFTIDQEDRGAFDVSVDSYGITGTISVPAMRLSTLTWRRDGDPEPWDSFYLQALPLFNDDYAPVLLSHILDRFASRRISYNTPGEFGRSVRRWLNLHLGAMSELNRQYASTAILMPLTTQDATIDTTSSSLSRDAQSDFPQGQLSGNLDYATAATDQAASATNNVDYQGRMGVSVMTLLAEQRSLYLNVDNSVLEAMEPLFLQVWDQDERDDELGTPYGSYIGSMFGVW
jgi:hypothetical protein